MKIGRRRSPSSSSSWPPAARNNVSHNLQNRTPPRSPTNQKLFPLSSKDIYQHYCVSISYQYTIYIKHIPKNQRSHPYFPFQTTAQQLIGGAKSLQKNYRKKYCGLCVFSLYVFTVLDQSSSFHLCVFLPFCLFAFVSQLDFNCSSQFISGDISSDLYRFSCLDI